MRTKIIVAAALLLGLVAWDFVAATTFVGDDYLFLAFARLEPNPLRAFVRDMHGGEYYRPLPMLLWWMLDRVGQGATWPFALAGFLLHAGSAALLVALGRGVGFPLRVSLAAGALFLVAPAEREAALWFSASTDLLATLATLAALVCLLRQSLKWEPWKGSHTLPRWCAAGTAGRLPTRLWQEGIPFLPFRVVRPAWALSCGCKSRRKEVNPTEAIPQLRDGRPLVGRKRVAKPRVDVQEPDPRRRRAGRAGNEPQSPDDQGSGDVNPATVRRRTATLTWGDLASRPKGRRRASGGARSQQRP
jgi:hypothetical protein